MGLLDWLFRRSRRDGPKSVLEEWGVSENGNAMLVVGASRITVFSQDRGWTYCIADIEDRQEPFFSEAYGSEEAARAQALAHLRGEPGRHEPLSAARTRDRKEVWEGLINDRERVIDELRSQLSGAPNLGLTALRKPEAKIASHLKQLGWQPAEYRRAGVSEEMIARAERQKLLLGGLAEEVAQRIAIKDALRKPRSAPVSASTLSADLAAKVDSVIRAFTETPVMSTEEQERLASAFGRKATERMIEEGLTYGQASGAPEFLNQDEASFREFMKRADQDLAWQCETVDAAFRRYRESGEVPAPHYPMRIAVLLRKAKDFDRERLFLSAWCKHFPAGNGTTYGALAERAKKVGSATDAPQ